MKYGHGLHFVVTCFGLASVDVTHIYPSGLSPRPTVANSCTNQCE